MNVDPLAAAIRSIIAPIWAVWERSPYLKYCRQLRRSQWETAESIRQRQWDSVRRIVDHAYRTTSFYRDRFHAAGLTPHSATTPEDLRQVPVLTKDDLRRHQQSLLSTAYCGGQLKLQRTSGSTGVSVEVLIDECATQLKRGATLRSDEWSGWRLGESVAVLWGTPNYQRFGWRGQVRNLLLERIRYLDTLKMDEAALGRFADDLRRRPPSLLFGHAHSLHLFAEFLRKQGSAGFRPRAIISSAMVLHEWERHTIEEVFHTRVTNRYGSEEVGLIACQCEEHGGLHVNSEGIYLEVLRSDGSAALPGEPGIVVITDLVNRAMPLIRYQIGDIGVQSDRPCRCGRGLPLLESVEGRIADYIVTPSGAVISGISLTDNFHTLIPGIVQMQIVQERIDWLRFRIVHDASYSPASEDELRQLVRSRFGPEFGYECEFVDAIPQEPSGKYRFCISKVPNPFSQPTPVVS